MEDIVQSVDRTLSILETLSDYENGLGIKEISELVMLNKSTVHRLLATLIYKGYVKQDKDTNKYMITLKLFELGNKKVAKMNLTSIAQPYLEELMEKTNEVVHLVVRDGNEYIYISKYQPKKPILMSTYIGLRKPLYCTAVGQAIMSQLSEDEIKTIWNTSDIKKYTKNTITDYDMLLKKIEKIKKDGYALDNQEVEDGIRCIGTVLKNYKNEVCGAVSVSGAIISFTDDKIDSFSNMLIECTTKISKELGYKL